MKSRIHKPSRRRAGTIGPRTWLSIRVELVEGLGERYWPRPGRLFAAAASHSYAQLATAIDDAFARWDRSHLHQFELGDGTRIGMLDPEWDVDESVVDERILNLARLKPGEQFVYLFDFGDDWAHLYTAGKAPINLIESLGLVPDKPL